MFRIDLYETLSINDTERNKKEVPNPYIYMLGTPFYITYYIIPHCSIIIITYNNLGAILLAFIL